MPWLSARQLRRGASLAVAFFAVGGEGAHVRRAAVQPTGTAAQQALAHADGPANEALAWQQRVAATTQHIWALVPKAEEKADDKASQSQGPVSMQVPEKEMNAFVKELSPKCHDQFTAIMHGQGPAIHTYGDMGTDTEESCTKLNGSICLMDARVRQEKAEDGRHMESTTNVRGKGCLPKECMSEKDLQVLANFMHLRAKDTMPSPDISVQLKVDCSKSGGSTAFVGGPPTTLVPSPDRHSSARTATVASRGLLLALAGAASMGMFA